jgi:hypothetical protein
MRLTRSHTDRLGLFAALLERLRSPRAANSRSTSNFDKLTQLPLFAQAISGCVCALPRGRRIKPGQRLRRDHPELALILERWRKSDVVILTTAFGKAFSEKGFSNFMADKNGLAGLPERCVTHGLRKAAARRRAEAGCSANEIAAITG